jgi:DnaD/phage-associated family protein
MSSKGWIKLHRKMLHNPIFQDAFMTKLWLYCLLKASHSNHKQLVGNKVVELEKGQFIWGRKEASADLNKGAKPKEKLSETTWERHLKTLEKLEMLTRETHNRFTLVTIDKWAVYQYTQDDFEQQDEQQMNKSCTGDEQVVHTNKNVKNLRIKELAAEEDACANEENPFVIYEQNFGILKPILQDRFIDWCEDLGDEIVIAGMKLAAQKGGRTFGYIEEIWKEWFEAGLKTIDQVRAHELTKTKRKNNTIPFKPRKVAGDIDWDNL